MTRTTLLVVVMMAASSCSGVRSPVRRGSLWEVRGELLETAGGLVQVRHKSGQTFAMRVTPTTRYLHDDLPVSPAELRAGRRVHVVATPRDGELVVTQVRIF